MLSYRGGSPVRAPRCEKCSLPQRNVFCFIGNAALFRFNSIHSSPWNEKRAASRIGKRPVLVILSAVLGFVLSTVLAAVFAVVLRIPAAVLAVVLIAVVLRIFAAGIVHIIVMIFVSHLITS